MVLESWREVDAVVLADVTDGLRRELLRLGRDAHRIEDVTTGGEIAPEGAGTDVSQTRQRRFTDKTVLVVIVNHCGRMLIAWRENSRGLEAQFPSNCGTIRLRDKKKSDIKIEFSKIPCNLLIHN